jgi:hypothetical protein
VKNRFQSLPFKCNLQRYAEVSRVAERLNDAREVGPLYNLHPVVVTHRLKAPGFKRLVSTLESTSEKLVSFQAFAF